jgi:aspartokinase
MALIVQKYGGTSMGSPERIKNVARRVAKWKAQGHDVVVVVSAMSGETNRLIALAKEIQAYPDPRELDVIISTGEQVTIGLLAMALKESASMPRATVAGRCALPLTTLTTRHAFNPSTKPPCGQTLLPVR